uniref:SAM-dependent methyltransferase, MidA family n=1 Tax=Candidatus Kentrum sp. FM TaxID=2126340 RepID=A0A450RVC0_9GAMM|nr:MAG: SAM-dependent methyltransferase, MidA family [Candidatus Kentron sp. FM]VFJ56466.1 MAG: SAM-dependent methyltransferase, MidA family [Candidatus Kentron sp. FM]VFK11479.1 MAG: SAM-dependent methyltransferase, MidA family [Candidatus Kentron sp. FM]
MNSVDISFLPQPDDAARQRSHALTALIRTEIEEAPSSAIPFERFMELALYAPELGYYQSESPKFGERGDFVTAPEILSFFSRCLARQAEQILLELGRGDILEVGAGSGVMAATLMQELHERGTLPGRYLILEKSTALRRLQQNTLSARIPELSNRFHWLDGPLQTPSGTGFRGVILANELLDAMPACRFLMAGSAVREEWVGWTGERFVRCTALARPMVERAVRHVERALGQPLPHGYSSEVHLAQRTWVEQAASRIEAGLLLLLDYGYPRAEYYHPQRYTGTLKCHYRHHLHDDPFLLPGLQDMSVHVDFSAIAEAAMAAGGRETGMELAGFTTQRDFLFSTGLLEMCAGIDPLSHEYLEIAQGIKTLTLPGEMGDMVKVMGLTRGIHGPLVGFGGRDLRGRL